MESGKSHAFRHADKTQRICLGWLSEQFRRKHYVLAYISTTLQAADILTKPFTNADKWRHAVRLLGHGIVKPDSRSPASPSTAAPTSDSRRRTEPEVKRVIIEICCSEDSLLGRVDGPYGSDCHVVRVTEKMDLNSYKTRRDLLEVAKGYAKRGVPILVWVSLPCTGGCTWTFVNLTIPQNAPNVYEEKRKFLKLWSSFVNLSTGLDCCPVHYALEWPRGCTYWDMKRVQKWLDNHKCVKANFDGCRLGLVNHEGIPVKKPWTIASTMSHLLQQLDGLRCTGGHQHAKCTKDSENYTKKMVHLVHKAFLNHCIAKQSMRPAAIAFSTLKHPALFSISISEIMASSGSASSVTRGAGNFPLPPDTVSRELIDQRALREGTEGSEPRRSDERRGNHSRARARCSGERDLHREHPQLSVAGAPRRVPDSHVGDSLQPLAPPVCPSGRSGRHRL